MGQEGKKGVVGGGNFSSESRSSRGSRYGGFKTLGTAVLLLKLYGEKKYKVTHFLYRNTGRVEDWSLSGRKASKHVLLCEYVRVVIGD